MLIELETDLSKWRKHGLLREKSNLESYKLKEQFTQKQHHAACVLFTAGTYKDKVSQKFCSVTEFFPNTIKLHVILHTQ